MKKRRFITLVCFVIACFSLAFGLSACDSEEPSAPAHTHSYTQSIVAPTCTEKGYTEYTCSCGDTYLDTYVNALGHSFTEYVSNEDATCEENGTETAVCSRENCNVEDTREDENSALGHSYGAWVSNGDGTHTKTCANDSTHTVTENCTGGNATCEDKPVCEGCEEEYGSALGHSFTNYVSNEDGTCEENGTETAVCDKGCGEEDTREIANSALGHSFTNYVSNEDATCEENGTETAVCDNGCGEEHTREDEDTAFGHDWNDGEITTAPTCLKKGVKTFTCGNCGDTYTEEVKALGHGYESVVTAPTCYEKGYTTHTCGNCSDSYTDTEVDALGHSFTNYESNGDATCEENGTETAVCDNGCGKEDTREDEDSAFGHSFTNYSSNNDGTKTATCDNGCGATDVVIDEYYYTEGLVFVLNNTKDAYRVSDYTGTETKVFIPSIYQELPVTSIGNFAFTQRSDIIEIIIPDSITSIGECAFYWCEKLAELEIPSSVTSIGECAFEHCHALTKIAIPNGVTTIESSTFSYCKNLTEIVIPDSVTSVGSAAFSYCSSLMEIVIGAGVTSIGNHAFSYCSSLMEIVIGDSVTSIGSSAFADCKRLIIYCEMESQPSGWGSDWNSSIPVVWNCHHNEVASDGYIYAIIDEIRYALKDGVAIVAIQPKSITTAIIPERVMNDGNSYNVTSIGSGAFYSCYNLTEIVLPNSVTSIGSSAFWNCDNLAKIVIPNYVTNIGDFAFYACNNLTEVVIPNNVTNIGGSAFWYCDGLKKVVIGNSVTSIGDSAFAHCKNLTKIIIPDNVTTIGSSAFEGCNSLTEITLPFVGASKEGTSNTHFGYIFGARSYSYNQSCVPISLKKVVITSATNIGANAFLDCNSITQIVLSNSVTSIYYNAFRKCSSLTEIIIPTSVASISDSAFYDCSSLTEIVIPASVTKVGYDAFYNCSSLTIYCEAESQPRGWNSKWNSSRCPVVWGYTGE